MVVFCDHRPIAFFCQPSQLYQSDDATPQYDQTNLKSKNQNRSSSFYRLTARLLQNITFKWLRFQTLVKPSCATSMVISVHMDANPTSMSADDMHLLVFLDSGAVL